MFAPYRRVLNVPHVRALVSSSVLGRLTFAVHSLGVVLFVEGETGSYGTAGAVAAVGALVAALGTPVTTRLIDRLGQTPVLVATACVHFTGVVALVALGLAGAPAGVLAAANALAAAANPPLSPALRGLWASLLPGPDSVRIALTIDAMLVEAVFVFGPLLVAVVLALASPAALLVVGAACAATGTLIFAAQPPSRTWRGEVRHTGLLGPLVSPGVRLILISGVTIGACFGALEVALPAFAEQHGSASVVGLVFAAQALGSAAGGLVYGARSAGRDVRRLYVVLLLGLGPGIGALALADTVWQMLLLAALSGCVLAPLTAAENELIGDVAPAGALTEAYGWTIMSVVTGFAIGNAAGGALVEGVSWQAAVLAPAVLATLAAGFTWLRAGSVLRGGAPAPAALGPLE